MAARTDVQRTGTFQWGRAVDNTWEPAASPHVKEDRTPYALVGHTHPTSAQFIWNYDNVEVMGDPGTGKLRTNQPAGTAATQIAISALDQSGVDVGNIIRQLDRTSLIYFQEADVADNWGRYQVVGALTDNSTWFQIPVQGVGDHGITISKNQPILIRLTYNQDVGVGAEAVLLGRIHVLEARVAELESKAGSTVRKEASDDPASPEAE